MLSVSQLNIATGVNVQNTLISSNQPSSSIAIIENLFEKLKCYLDEWHPDENFQKTIVTISSILQEKTLDEFEIDANANYLFHISENWHLAHFHISCAYAITAREDGIGISGVARWKLISQAFFLLGKAEGLIDKESQRDLKIHIFTSIKGGERRAAKLAMARIECARLLKANMPPDGWPSDAVAIENIKTELSTFIAKHQIQYIPSRLEQNIYKWKINDDAVRASFIETKSKKINYK